MARGINFKEYTRIRDIVVKRNKRAVQAGLMPALHFPTVAEIKSGFVSPSEALSFVKSYYSSGSQVKSIRQTGLTPDVVIFPEMPKPKPVSEEIKKERRREQQRRYRRIKKVRETAITPAKGKKYESYLKALESVSRTWRKQGFNIGIDLQSLTPSQAQAFVEYMDYRFAQGDFTQRYVIDEFIQDFSKLMKKGHSPKDITSDFNKFLENRLELENRANNMEGLSNAEFMNYWDEFIGE